ncbi:hypothetical protein GQ85_19795 [Rhodococcus rhodochrous]|nr:hypothetical protein GQ85_19795 [Rhodococcus rhodochrous]
MTGTARKLTIDDLESVYLDGFCSGIASFATDSGMGAEQADAIATLIANSVRNDRDGIAEVRRQIVERINDPDGESLDARNVTITIGGGR